MDPLSISAGVAGFLGLGIQIAQILGRYISEVKSAPEDAKALFTEVNSLNAVLSQLTEFLETQEISAEFSETSVLVSVIEMCQKNIQNIYQKLSSLRRVKKWGVNMEQLKWPFDKKDCMELATKLSHFVQIMQFSLTVSNCELLSKTSKAVAEELKKHKEQLNGIAALFPVLPAEMQKMNQTLSTVLQFLSAIPDMEAKLEDISNGVKALHTMRRDDERSKILDQMKTLEPWKRHSDISNTRAANTCGWLLNTPEFVKWFAGDKIDMSNARGRILCCYGMPGAGKTVLASYIIDHITEYVSSQESYCIAYVYCDYRDAENLTPLNVICSLLQQLLSQLPAFSSQLEEELVVLCEELKKRKSGTFQHVIQLLTLTFNTFKSTFICIDALDEVSDAPRKAILNALCDGMGRRTRIFLTGRPHVRESIERYLHVDDIPSITIEADEGDIYAYLSNEIQKDHHPDAMDATLKEEILEAIINQSQGMFLLPAFHIRMVLDHLTKAKRRKALTELPSDLYSAFAATISRIKCLSPHAAEIGMNALTWVHYAERELIVAELQEALAVEPGDTNIDRDNRLPLNTILECCLGLVIVNEETSTVRLVHYSLEEYLIKHHRSIFPKGQGYIAELCLTYLNFEAFTYHSLKENPLCEEPIGNSAIEMFGQSGITDYTKHTPYNSMRFALLEYAVLYWGVHAREDPEFKESVCKSAIKFITQPEVTFGEILFQISYWAMISKDDSRTLLPNTVHIEVDDWRSPRFCRVNMIAAFGLVPLFHDKSVDINEKTRYGRTPLMIACSSGHTELVELLLNRPEVDINYQDELGENALMMSIKSHCHTITKLLLAHPQIEINSRDLKQCTPLIIAICCDNQTALELLLSKREIEQSVNLRCGTERPFNPPLIWVMLSDSRGDLRSRMAMVELLIFHPAVDINLPDSQGCTPLHRACLLIAPRIVELLLNIPKPISLNELDSRGRTALNIACGSSMNDPRIFWSMGRCDPDRKFTDAKTVVKTLLQNPDITASINQPDSNGETPLCNACWSGNFEIVELLLERPEIHLSLKPNEYGVHLIQVAMRSQTSEIETLRLLLKRPEITDSLDYHCNKPESIRYSNSFLVEACSSLDESKRRGTGYRTSRILSITPEVISEVISSKAGSSVKWELDPQRFRIPVPRSVPSCIGVSDIVELLLRTPAIISNFNKPESVDDAITAAFSYGNFEIAKLFLESPEILCQISRMTKSNATDKTPFFLACRSGDLDTVELILKSAELIPDLNSEIIEPKQHPLYAACLGSNPKLVKLLLKTPEVVLSLNKSDEYFKEALKVAHFMDYQGVADVLLSYPDIERHIGQPELKLLMDQFQRQKREMTEMGILPFPD
ncbi:hypothetical protein DFH27DRAFT_584918 [Peziza echinospora]|nr:hypothetical protein DFH27DRAFT_584918 [Peziza echinospora]